MSSCVSSFSPHLSTFIPCVQLPEQPSTIYDPRLTFHVVRRPVVLSSYSPVVPSSRSTFHVFTFSRFHVSRSQVSTFHVLRFTTYSSRLPPSTLVRHLSALANIGLGSILLLFLLECGLKIKLKVRSMVK